MKLSEHFTLAELTMSPKATKLKIDNTPTPEHLENLIVLSENVLEPIRAKFGSFSPTSGYRSPKLNAATPGASKTSQHSKGEAVDIDLGTRNKELFDWVRKNIAFDQMIWEYGDDSNPSWVHVSFSAERTRKQVLRCYGATDYRPYKG